MRTDTTNIHAIAIGFLACVAALSLSFAGCSEDPIFASIENEVELKDPSILGINVISLVSFQGDIYTANGNLYRKTAGSGDWHKMALPVGAKRCYQVAVDSATGTLFALFQDGSWQFESLQMYDGASWTPVAGMSSIIGIGNGAGFIFAFREDSRQDNDSNTSEFSAYRVAGDGSSALLIDGLASIPVSSVGNWFATSREVYQISGTTATLVSVDDGDAVENDYPTSGIKGLATDGTRLFVGKSGYAYRYDGSSWTRFAHDTATPVTGITWLGAGKNMLLVSGDEGYGEVLLDVDGNMTKYQEPGNNSTSSIATSARDQYESTLDDWNLSSIFAVTSPVPSGDEYCLYSCVVETDNDGLWGYYSSTQKEWNRE